MNKASIVILAASVVLLAMGCGDDNYLKSLSREDSSAACRYQVSMDLDSGNFDAVTASPCANHMDKAAAYLGKAGFGIIEIINRMIEASDSGGGHMDVYMKDLVGNVSTQDIVNLDLSTRNYSMVNAANGYSTDMEKDALFLRSALVQPTISFSFIKSSIDPDGDGAISSCDINGNSVPDEVDAVSCALTVASGTADCSSLGIALDDSTYRTLSFTGYSSVYNGLVMDYSGVTNASCPQSTYYQLLYASSSVAVTSLEKCVDPSFPLIQWNCPYEDSLGSSVDMLSVFNEAILNSLDTMNALGFNSTSDVYAAVDSISTEACGGGVCTEAQLQAYLQSQLAQ